MKLSDYKGEDAIILLADILVPASKILANKKVKQAYEKKLSNAEFASVVLRENPKEVIEILAMLDNTPVEEYEVNVITLPMKLLDLLNDPDIVNLFKSQGQSSDKTSSGSAMENTGADGQ